MWDKAFRQSKTFFWEFLIPFVRRGPQSNGKCDAWGKGTIVEGDKVTIFGTGGTVPKGCAKAIGVYHFTLVKDTCHERRKNVTLDWTKK